MRQEFIDSLRAKYPDAYPEQPVDYADKKTQQQLRNIAMKGVEEVFESLVHFKNWKNHRTQKTQVFDRDAFVEEMVDALNYFMSLLIMVDVDAEELFEIYKKKDAIIHERIKNDY